MADGTESLGKGLAEEFGAPDPAFDIVAEMDPALARAFIGMSRAATRNSSLGAKERALINIALNASVCDLRPDHTRHWTAVALKEGASREEICEVLELAAVLGIHGFIPGVQMLIQRAGGLEAFKAKVTPERRERAEAAIAKLTELRGVARNPIWEAGCYCSPDLMEAYAEFSAVPWQTNALSPKLKELIYVAIDLSPTHLELNGGAAHISRAQEVFGVTDDEIVDLLEIIALSGFRTQLMALPILKEELARAAEGSRP